TELGAAGAPKPTPSPKAHPKQERMKRGNLQRNDDLVTATGQLVGTVVSVGETDVVLLTDKGAVRTVSLVALLKRGLLVSTAAGRRGDNGPDRKRPDHSTGGVASTLIGPLPSAEAAERCIT